MKIQDILFIAVLIFFLYRGRPKETVLGGILSLILSVPLFSFWVFFTAERLVWYAFAFFFLSVLQYFKKFK